MTRPVRIGMIGSGGVMTPYMAAAKDLASMGLAEVVAACDRADDVFHRKDVDLVLVLTPVEDHGPLVRAALEAGKHVLVERVMAPTLGEAADLVEVARRAPGHLVCAPHVLLSPTHREIARRIRRGDIGKVCTARARTGGADPCGQGGGALFESAVSSVTSLTGWLGPARRVQALAGAALSEREIGGRKVRVEAEDTAQVLIDFGEGVLGLVMTGFAVRRPRSPAIELYGSTGTIQMLGDDGAPRGYELWQNDVGSWMIFDEADPAWPWTDGLRHLVECIRGGRRPVITPEHAYHVLEILVRAKESAKDGRARPLESAFEPVEREVEIAYER
jgi:predicted dehydrogenase